MKRKLGAIYYFDYPQQFESLPDYTAHRGQQCRVVCELTPEAYDFGGGDRMYLVQFNDGFLAHGWASELSRKALVAGAARVRGR